MRRRTLVALAVGLAVATVVYLAAANRPKPPRRRAVYGGRASAAGRWPFVALVKSSPNSQVGCTGFLIDPTHVMTAWHCTAKGYGAPGSQVVIGAARSSGSGEVHAVKRLFKSGVGPVASPQDWSIVELATPSSAKPAKLNGWQVSIPDAELASKDLVTMGYGRQPGGSAPYPLNEGTVRVSVSRGMYRTANRSAAGVCPGDSGGPLVYRSPTAGDVVVGVASAVSGGDMCGPHQNIWTPTRPVGAAIRRILPPPATQAPPTKAPATQAPAAQPKTVPKAVPMPAMG
jgi:hypothetical protein